MDDKLKKLIGLYLIQKRRKTVKRLWCRQWILQRHIKGSYASLFNDLRLSQSTEDFRKYLRMPSTAFYFILDAINPLISKQNTTMRESIPSGAKLEATLLFLATGMSYSRLEYHTRISDSSLGYIIPETCKAIYTVLQPEFFKVRALLLHLFPILIQFFYSFLILPRIG